MLAQSRERYESRHALQARGIDVDHLAARMAELLGISVEQVWQPGKARPQVKARRLLCYWAVCELGETMTAMAGRLGLSTAAVSMAVVRGAEIAKRNGYPII